jgi:hypothetical protein
MLSDNESIRLIFGLKVKVLRQEKGLNYQQLSEKTGLAVSYLHSIENGKKYPKADKIIQLAKALDVDYDYLVSLSASKKLQPIIDLMQSGFLQELPWEHLGIQPSALIDLFAETPDKLTAFISTLLKLSRSVHLSKGDFYMSALRSYQDLHNNYFEELEVMVQKFASEAFSLDGEYPITASALENLLQSRFGISIDRKSMAAREPLQNLRSYFSPKKKVLFLNKGLSPSQEKFLIARELAFQELKLAPRPLETVMLQYASFEILLKNFQASYFASALLLPEARFLEEIKDLFSSPKWNPERWLNVLDTYDVTPEMLLQRLTNLLPRHLGLEQLFFLRMRGDVAQSQYEMTKELHLARLHNPYASALHEHYCRRWLAIHLMKETDALPKNKKGKQTSIGVQISQYWQTHNSYLCITLAKPETKRPEKITSVTLGIMIEPKSVQKILFSNDLQIPVKTVHTTCERCGVENCAERAARPIQIEMEQKRQAVEEAIEKLEG